MTTVGGGGGASGPGSVVERSRSSGGFNTSRPSWLQATLADLDEKMKTLALNLHEEDDSDSFAVRAENYYRKRPLLLNLLQDLYNGYLSLADRYCQNLIKQSRFSSSPPISAINFDFYDNGSVDDSYSDAESSLSYQAPPPPPPLVPQTEQTQNQNTLDTDTLIAQLVIKHVDYEILMHELAILERCNSESSRKMDLQKSLLEVLESERLVLLSENARLGYRVNALVEENKGLVSESMLMKRKAGELARCVLKMREDHRVCLLVRKIEDLQCQIFGLEKRNREYCEQLVVRREEDEKENPKRKDDVAAMENRWVRAEMFGKKAGDGGGGMKKINGNGGSKWWGKVKKIDMFFLCGPNSNQQIR